MMVGMAVVVDHLFVCMPVGAPAADRLRQFGLTEGSSNRHPGQGTACRRFFFQNAMLEFLWVENAAEAQSEQTRATRLWERWSATSGEASPFGIIVRPAPGVEKACPFETWDYRPPTMPDLSLRIAAGTALQEPMWCYMESGRRPADAPPERRQPLEHDRSRECQRAVQASSTRPRPPLLDSRGSDGLEAGFREITAVHLTCPQLPESSVTAAMARAGVIGLSAAAGHLLEVHFDGLRLAAREDFRPDLPLVLRW
jgi:hypothetical protein